MPIYRIAASFATLCFPILDGVRSAAVDVVLWVNRVCLILPRYFNWTIF